MEEKNKNAIQNRYGSPMNNGEQAEAPAMRAAPTPESLPQQSNIRSQGARKHSTAKHVPSSTVPRHQGADQKTNGTQDAAQKEETGMNQLAAQAIPMRDKQQGRSNPPKAQIPHAQNISPEVTS